jgi:hypothetical protein
MSDEDPFRLLDAEAVPPPELKARVRRTLEAGGYLRPRRRPTWRVPLAAAAVLAVFLAGVEVGRPGPAAAPSQQFVLLLYEDAGFHAGDEQAFVAEYRAWGERWGREGKVLGGEKLAATGRLLRAADDSVLVSEAGVVSDAGALAGWFVIAARDYAEATAIARTHPHLGHGGRVAVRAIEPT